MGRDANSDLEQNDFSSILNPDEIPTQNEEVIVDYDLLTGLLSPKRTNTPTSHDTEVTASQSFEIRKEDADLQELSPPSCTVNKQDEPDNTAAKQNYYEQLRQKVKRISSNAALDLCDITSTQTTSESALVQQPRIVRIIERPQNRPPFLPILSKRITTTTNTQLSSSICSASNDLSAPLSSTATSYDETFTRLTTELREIIKKLKCKKLENIEPSTLQHAKHLQEITFLTRRSLMKKLHLASSIADKCVLYSKLLNDQVVTYEYELITTHTREKMMKAVRTTLNNLVSKYNPRTSSSQTDLDIEALNNLCRECQSECLVFKIVKKIQTKEMGIN
ncbi:unnamed protein product, partial [Didymodactylos carnosus]